MKAHTDMKKLEAIAETAIAVPRNKKANVLLEGPIGTGKTVAIGTAIPFMDHVFILALEPGIKTAIEKWREWGLDTSKVHYIYIPQAITDWPTLTEGARKLNQLSMKQAAELPAYDKHKYQQFLQIYSVCSNFTCDCCDKSWGAVDHWDADALFAIDGLSGMSRMATQFVTGSKPIRTLPEIGAAQDLIRNLLKKLTGDTSCSVVLISHIDRNLDLITGGTNITVDTIGQKLAPSIPKDFDEVVLTKRVGSTFLWSTDEAGVDLKARRLPYSSELPPTFAQLFT